ncbi:MAG: ATP-binding cassette domain-containing protein [Acidimicrobiales bacterium]
MHVSPPSGPPAIAAHGLRMAFGDHIVLDGIDLEVSTGTVFALLGPNGAGKTTMVHILSTLLRPDDGRASVGGFDVVKDAADVRGLIGLTGQFAAVDGLLTGAENLQLMADLHHLSRSEGRQRVGDLLDQFELVDAAGAPVATYSGGMRRRLDLAMTLVGRPRIIFLDEPTTGLDPRSRRTMWQIVRGLVAEGVTIFLTTQYLDEADHLADRIAILDHGRLIAEGTASELKRLVPGGHVRLRFADVDRFESAGERLPEATGDPETLTLAFPSDGGIDALRALLDDLDRVSVEPQELSIHTPDLDDVFFALTGHDDDVGADHFAHRGEPEEVPTP